MGYYSEILAERLRSELLKSLLSYKLIHLQEKYYTPGNMVVVFSADIEVIKDFGSNMLGECVLAIFAILMAFSFSLYLNWVMPISMLIVFPFF